MSMTVTATATDKQQNIKTYRHEFSKQFIDELSRFSKVHQYDDRHVYKSEWTKWISNEEISSAIDFEKRRLQENGYKGDIEDKMFKAGRYYFRKKSQSRDTATVTPTPTPRTRATRATRAIRAREIVRRMARDATTRVSCRSCSVRTWRHPTVSNPGPDLGPSRS